MKTKVVNSIEGIPTSGPFLVKPLTQGAQISMLEVRLERGVQSELHSHTHESVIYLVSGRLESLVGDKLFALAPGDSCHHPENVPHSVKALEDSVFVETKSPVPDLTKTLGIS